MSNSNVTIQVFTKAPIAGYCKTRLAEHLGEQQTLKFHQDMIEKTLSTVCGIKNVDIQLWCNPSINHPFFSHIECNYPVILKQQNGSNLGEILFHASKEIKQNDQLIVQIGTDCPSLSQNYINTSIQLLSDNDIVIGPAHDGGYVLLSHRENIDNIYNDIEWGGANVLSSLENNLQSSRYTYTKLNALADIDTYNDYCQHIEKVAFA